MGILQGFPKLFITMLFEGIDVVSETSGKQDRILRWCEYYSICFDAHKISQEKRTHLRNDCELGAKVVETDFGDVQTVNNDSAAGSLDNAEKT